MSLITVFGFPSCSVPSASERETESWSDSVVTDFCRNFLQLATRSAQEDDDWICSNCGGGSSSGEGKVSKKYQGYFQYVGTEAYPPVERFAEEVRSQFLVAPNLIWVSPESEPGVFEATYHEGRQFGEFKVIVDPPRSGDKIVKVVFEIEEKTLME